MEIFPYPFCAGYGNDGFSLTAVRTQSMIMAGVGLVRIQCQLLGKYIYMYCLPLCTCIGQTRSSFSIENHDYHLSCSWRLAQTQRLRIQYTFAFPLSQCCSSHYWLLLGSPVVHPLCVQCLLSPSRQVPRTESSSSVGQMALECAKRWQSRADIRGIAQRAR